jgi:hypothetical protein
VRLSSIHPSVIFGVRLALRTTHEEKASNQATMKWMTMTVISCGTAFIGNCAGHEQRLFHHRQMQSNAESPGFDPTLIDEDQFQTDRKSGRLLTIFNLQTQYDINS